MPLMSEASSLLVDGLVIVEVKRVSKIAPIHRAQLLTYLRLTGLQLGLIINFKVERLVDGIKRVVNGYQVDEEREEYRPRTQSENN